MGWVAKCWRDHELPDGRAPETFAYMVEEFTYMAPDGDVYVTDTLYTDDPAEAARIATAMWDQGYGSRVTRRPE